MNAACLQRVRQLSIPVQSGVVGMTVFGRAKAKTERSNGGRCLGSTRLTTSARPVAEPASRRSCRRIWCCIYSSNWTVLRSACPPRLHQHRLQRRLPPDRATPSGPALPVQAADRTEDQGNRRADGVLRPPTVTVPQQFLDFVLRYPAIPVVIQHGNK